VSNVAVTIRLVVVAVRHCQLRDLCGWDGRRLASRMRRFGDRRCAILQGFHFPAEIISHCIWLCYRLSLSLREVQEMMLQRGIIISHETVQQWCAKFGQTYANGLRRRRAHPGDTWHLDEVFIAINGKRHYLWHFLHPGGSVGAIGPQPDFSVSCSPARSTCLGCWSPTSSPATPRRAAGFGGRLSTVNRNIRRTGRRTRINRPGRGNER